MKRKSVREMGSFARKRHSLTIKSMLGVQALALIVGVIVLVAGFALYFMGILYEYCAYNAKLAKAEAVMLDLDQTRAKADEIIKIYDAAKAAGQADQDDPAYQAKFDGTTDDEFKDIQRRLRIMKERVGLRNAFVVGIEVHGIPPDGEGVLTCTLHKA